MDIASKKLSLIQWLLSLNDQEIINELDAIRKKLSTPGKSMKQYSLEELFAKLERSAKDYENGNYLTVEELEKEIKNGRGELF